MYCSYVSSILIAGLERVELRFVCRYLEDMRSVSAIFLKFRDNNYKGWL